jgi:hypothetical protein
MGCHLYIPTFATSIDSAVDRLLRILFVQSSPRYLALLLAEEQPTSIAMTVTRLLRRPRDKTTQL